MKPRTVVQQKAIARVENESLPTILLCWMNLGCWNVSYESCTSPFIHAYHVVRAPTLILFLHATLIISELCPLLVYPYYAGKYASILCAGLGCGRCGGKRMGRGGRGYRLAGHFVKYLLRTE